MGDVRVGCAGWYYDDWVGAVYPPRLTSEAWLSHYASLFPMVEVDATFYRVPEPAVVQGWLERVADRPTFRFAVKLDRRVTHELLPAGLLDDAHRAVEAYVDAVVKPLEAARRLEAVLVQLPPAFGHAERVAGLDALDAILQVVAALDPKRRRVAVEFRHTSWYEHVGERLVPDVADAFTGRGVAAVHVDGLGMRFDQSRTADWSYFRLHGRRSTIPASERALPHARYNYLYSAAELADLAGRVQKAAVDDASTLVIFNNHYRGQAARNGLDMMRAMGQRVQARLAVPREARLDDFLGA
jgi:uncharacterized protein YecE (DUF72 family)